MSTPRGLANHSLYLAGILLDGWQAALEKGSAPRLAVDQAYLPGVRRQLQAAYGWFLLELSDHEAPESGRPPLCRAELPAVPAGKAEAAELRECEQLERDGWLAELLAMVDTPPGGAASPGNLAAPDTLPGDREFLSRCRGELQALFERMRDSLDEY